MNTINTMIIINTINTMNISKKNKFILKKVDVNFKKPYLIDNIIITRFNLENDALNIALDIKEIILNLNYNTSYCFSNNYIKEYIILSEYKYRLEKILYEYKFDYFGCYYNSFVQQAFFNLMIQNMKNILNDDKIKILYKNEYSEDINKLIKSSNYLIDYFIKIISINLCNCNELLHYIIKYKQQQFKISKLKEELMANVWHPKNFEKFKYLDFETFGEEE